MSQSNNSFPFYIHPMNHKRSVQIIKEAKAEIKKMESRRPRTPFCPKNSTRSGFQPGQSRPNSSTSLRSLQFENEEDSHITSTKVSSLQTIKGDSNIKLEPIVVKSSMQPPKLRDSRLKKQSESDFVGLPPITYEDISHKTHGEEYSENGSKYKEEIAIPANGFSPTEGNCFFSCQTGAEQDDEQEIRELSIKRQSIDLQDIEGSTQEDSSCKPDQISSQIAKFLPLLESSISLVRKQDEEAVIVLIHEIHNILEMEGSFDAMFENRTSLLKLLFRLLDSNYPILSLHTANLLLKMKLKDKNLTTVLRFILKLTKDFEIDLEHFHLIETLIKLMQTISVMACPEAVLHATMIIKSLICSDTISKQIVKEFIAILFHHLEDSNLMMDSHKEELDNHDHFVIQVISVLHTVADNKSTEKLLIKPENINTILKTFYNFVQNSEVTQILVRFISKLVDKSDGRRALLQCKEYLTAFPTILEKYKFHLDITLQLTFIIGNLVSEDENVALSFVFSQSFCDILIHILKVYVKEHLQVSSSDSTESKMFLSCGDRNWRDDILEAILKILCIWANICLSPKAGYQLGKKDSVITHLLDIVGAYVEHDKGTDADLILHSILVVVGNISYYIVSDSELCIEVSKCVIPLLDDSYSFEIRLESANIIRNLTRSPKTRAYIQEHSLLPAFIQLLREDGKDFNTAAYGIIMNLLIDRTSCELFYKEEGVTRLLHKLHLCADRDWKTCAFLCQILWNYCGGENADTIPIKKIEAQHLLKYLTYSLRENSGSTNRNTDQVWSNEFCPVAQKLLELLKTKKCCIS